MNDKIIKPLLFLSKYEIIKLNHGITVIFIEDKYNPFSNLSLSINISGIKQKIEGITHLFEHVISLKIFNEINELIKISDGYYNAYTTPNFMSFYYFITNKYFKKSLNIFIEKINKLSFDKDIITNEITAIDHEFNIIRKDAEDYFLSKMFLNKNIGFKDCFIGNKETLKGNIIKYLKDFYEEYFNSKNIFITVSCNNINKYKDIINNLSILIPFKKYIIKKKEYNGNIFNSYNIIESLSEYSSNDNLIYVWELPLIKYKSNTLNPYGFFKYLLENRIYSLETILVKLINIGGLNIFEYFLCNYRSIMGIKIFNTKNEDNFIKNYILIAQIIKQYFDVLLENINSEEMKRTYNNFKNKINFNFNTKTCFHDYIKINISNIISLNKNFKNNELITECYTKLGEWDLVKINLKKLLTLINLENIKIIKTSKNFNKDNLNNYINVIKSNYKIYKENINLNNSNIKNLLNFEEIEKNIYDCYNKKKVNNNIKHPIKIIDKNLTFIYFPFFSYKLNYNVIINIVIEKYQKNNLKWVYFCYMILEYYIKDKFNKELNELNNSDYTYNLYTNKNINIEFTGNYKNIFKVIKLFFNILNNPGYIFKNNFIDLKNKVYKEILDNYKNHNTENISLYFNSIYDKNNLYLDEIFKDYDKKIDYDFFLETINMFDTSNIYKIFILGNCNIKLKNKLYNFFYKYKSNNKIKTINNYKYPKIYKIIKVNDYNTIQRVYFIPIKIYSGKVDKIFLKNKIINKIIIKSFLDDLFYIKLREEYKLCYSLNTFEETVYGNPNFLFYIIKFITNIFNDINIRDKINNILNVCYNKIISINDKDINNIINNKLIKVNNNIRILNNVKLRDEKILNKLNKIYLYFNTDFKKYYKIKIDIIQNINKDDIINYFKNKYIDNLDMLIMHSKN